MTSELDRLVDNIERELSRLHPETITPVEWIKLRAMVFDLLRMTRENNERIEQLGERARETLERVRKLEKQCPESSAKSLLSWALNKARRR